ncbi:MAG: AmmeMemoRadiSam system radical SAM enzyme [Bacteroidetes bacterium HGW-Bacteroidetes-17]|nr:MAG: AmmeMemoRadiSam system radical SAM enzyme [Bacteroidetes bacterium HGW-Bacteroidetes-17]
MKKAAFFEKLGQKKVRCNLCPHHCLIGDGKSGICLVRKNIGGDLFSENYEKLSAISTDPIEKKPLYHFYPGKKILSIGSVGCNLKCKFCQNYEISQVTVDEFAFLKSYTSEEIVQMALEKAENIGLAYTYNEPIIWYEFVLETARLAHQHGLKNVFVSNGFINPDPLNILIGFMDAFSIDLKGFTEDFYKNLTSSGLAPVLKSIKQIKKADKHIELTNLVIPGLNDDEEKFIEMIDWIAEEIGEDTVLHISRYFPMFKIKNLPTPESKLESLYEIARRKLTYVYLGNMKTLEGQNTLCPNCNAQLISRSGYITKIEQIDKSGNCAHCGQQILKYYSS